MLYGTPQRAAHRAPADGVHALHGPRPGRRAAPSGLRVVLPGRPRPSRVGAPARHWAGPSRRRASPEPERAAQFLARGLATLIVLGITVLTGIVVVSDERRGRGSSTSALAAPAGVLDSRATDATPLTLQEVFPDRGQVRAPAAPTPYRITMTHIDSECRIAGTGALGPLLQEQGCDQVVRAGLTAPYGDYQVTAGLFNLADAAGATDLEGRLRGLVESGDGGFAAMAGGEPGSQVGWRAHGHYLLFCVITRPGGALVSADDPYARRITEDLVDGYLSGTVLGRREPGTGPGPRVSGT
jgi:hypothetical protein